MASQAFGSERAQRAHLVRPGGGVSGEVADLRSDVDKGFESVEAQSMPIYVDEFVDPVAADTDAILTSQSSSDTRQEYTGSDLDGVVGTDEMVPPRNITITTSASADIDAVDVIVRGFIRNADGELVAQEEDITLSDAGGATDSGTRAFSTISEIIVPEQSGGGGTLEVGFGPVIGLSRPLKTRAGLANVLREVVGGAEVSTGTFADADAQAPHGTYTPSSAPDGSTTYAVVYESASW